MENIEFNRKKDIEFKKTYETAKQYNQEVFTFNEHQFFIGYARYLLEYLEMKFKKEGGQV